MEKIAGEFDATRLIRYADDFPMLFAAMARNKKEKEQSKKVNKPVQSSIVKQAAPFEGYWKRKFAEKFEGISAAGRRAERKRIANIIEARLAKGTADPRWRGLVNKPFTSYTDEDIRMIMDPAYAKDPIAPKISAPGPEIKAPSAAKVPEGLRSKINRLPGWLKAVGVLGGAGLAGYAGYKIYKSSQKKKAMEKEAGLFSIIAKKFQSSVEEHDKKEQEHLLRKINRLQAKLDQRRGAFVRTKLREM